MINFDIRITEDTSDVSIYPSAASISIVNDVIEVVYEDERFQHPIDQTSEIIININR